MSLQSKKIILLAAVEGVRKLYIQPNLESRQLLSSFLQQQQKQQQYFYLLVYLKVQQTKYFELNIWKPQRSCDNSFRNKFSQLYFWKLQRSCDSEQYLLIHFSSDFTESK
eukprot:TRINITY_DN3679_c0_g1_i1.p11 TRINITY_DN3679_c0_g1~~TRINITY_DN3679_c0_g1_i1.p11  ORF type:complete len:110 (+),score=3.35 TRINITY_DN3679_c0_g1_i1:455-784(+)